MGLGASVLYQRGFLASKHENRRKVSLHSHSPQISFFFVGWVRMLLDRAGAQSG